MYILLIIWVVFVAFYLGFNFYGISRVMAMRIKNDATPKAILIYLIAIFIVIAISILFMSQLDWGRPINLF